MRVRKHKNYDAVCLHSQQCIEKLMKALLIQRKVVPPYIHDLVKLSDLIRRGIPSWKWSERQLDTLSRGAVLLRYPGKSASLAQARSALRMCKALRQALLKLL
jgi:HEPN domain-containing protein